MIFRKSNILGNFCKKKCVNFQPNLPTFLLRSSYHPGLQDGVEMWTLQQISKCPNLIDKRTPDQSYHSLSRQNNNLKLFVIIKHLVHPFGIYFVSPEFRHARSNTILLEVHSFLLFKFIMILLDCMSDSQYKVFISNL